MIRSSRIETRRKSDAHCRVALLPPLQSAAYARLQLHRWVYFYVGMEAALCTVPMPIYPSLQRRCQASCNHKRSAAFHADSSIVFSTGFVSVGPVTRRNPYQQLQNQRLRIFCLITKGLVRFEEYTYLEPRVIHPPGRASASVLVGSWQEPSPDPGKANKSPRQWRGQQSKKT